MKKNFLLSSFVCLISLIITNGFAERCPTPDEIKQQGFGMWQPYYDGNHAHQNMIREFKSHVTAFYEADYMLDDVYDGPAQCFYRNQDDEPMEMYLVRSDLKIIESDSSWKNNGNSFSCISKEINICQFFA